MVDYVVAENPALAATVKSWQSEFEPWSQEVLSVAADDLEVKRCRQEECYMGDFIADAMLDIVRAPLIKQGNIENPDKP